MELAGKSGCENRITVEAEYPGPGKDAEIIRVLPGRGIFLFRFLEIDVFSFLSCNLNSELI